jgi:hypothetical protein
MIAHGNSASLQDQDGAERGQCVSKPKAAQQIVKNGPPTRAQAAFRTCKHRGVSLPRMQSYAAAFAVKSSYAQHTTCMYPVRCPMQPGSCCKCDTPAGVLSA